jgi:hypothetical protein
LEGRKGWREGRLPPLSQFWSSVGGLGDGVHLDVDAVLEHGFDFEEGFVVGIEVGAVFDLAKGGLKDGETVPGFQHVDGILGIDAHGWGTFVSMEA